MRNALQGSAGKGRGEESAEESKMGGSSSQQSAGGRRSGGGGRGRGRGGGGWGCGCGRLQRRSRRIWRGMRSRGAWHGGYVVVADGGHGAGKNVATTREWGQGFGHVFWLVALVLFDRKKAHPPPPPPPLLLLLNPCSRRQARGNLSCSVINMGSQRRS